MTFDMGTYPSRLGLVPRIIRLARRGQRLSVALRRAQRRERAAAQKLATRLFRTRQPDGQILYRPIGQGRIQLTVATEEEALDALEARPVRGRWHRLKPADADRPSGVGIDWARLRGDQTLVAEFTITADEAATAFFGQFRRERLQRSLELAAHHPLIPEAWKGWPPRWTRQGDRDEANL